jgi:phosphoribosyl-ATP pyrophosphohydrolase
MADKARWSDADVLAAGGRDHRITSRYRSRVLVCRVLFAKGDDAIVKKIGEEATETVMAAKDGDVRRIARRWPTCGSTASCSWCGHGVSPSDVLASSRARRDSGHAEKAARGP